MRNRLLVSTALLALSAFASTPVATVTSVEPFLLDGRAVATQQITSFPLVVGDDLATAEGAAVLVFVDGSSVKLAAGSRAKLTGSEKLPKLVLLSGSLDYKLVLGSSLSVTNLDLERVGKPAGRAPWTPAKPLHTPRGDEITLTAK